jgi:hypothetical protein
MTRIQLLGDIEGYLDIAEEVNVPLNFGISDIRDLSKKSGALSKSIKVAGTKENSKLLNHLFDVNIASNSATFNVNRKQAVILWQDNDVVFDNAIMQLVSVEVVSVGSEATQTIEYIVLLKDTVGDFFTDLGNSELTDLDFTDLNHTYSSANVVASFAHTVADGYKYTLPYTQGINYFLQEMKPAIYSKLYWDRIFARAGKSYQWDDLQLEQFDKMLHPYNGGKVGLTNDYLEEEEVKIEFTGEFKNVDNQNIPATLVEALEVKDLQGYYDDVTHSYNNPYFLSPPNMLVYQLEIEYDLIIRNDSSFIVSRGTSAIEYAPTLRPLQDGNPTTGNTVFNHSLASFTQATIVNSGNTVRLNQGAGGTFNFLASSDTVIATVSQVIDIPLVNIPNLADITLEFLLISSNTTPFQRVVGGLDEVQVYPVIDVTTFNVTIRPSSDSIGLGFPVKMNDYIPKRVKQAEYVKSIMTMFNLFAVPDENNDQNLIFMSRDKYYDTGRVVNWERKKAKELGETITFLPDITSKRLALSYKEDNDLFNENYTANTSEVYGQIEYTFDNEFVKNDERKEITFTPSPFVRTSFDALVNAVNGSEPKTGMRIVLDGGMYACGEYRILDYILPNGSGVGEVLFSYPLTIHFDKPTNPNYDINFAICDYYFDSGLGVITNNNLANRHWRRSMAQINSGKLLTVYLTLNSVDIANMRMNDKIFINGSYWNINKVIDYSANKRIPTKVELISADDDLRLPAFPRIIPADPNIGDATITAPTKGLNGVRNESLNIDLSGGGVIISGTGNYIAPNVRNAVVVGDNQTIDKDGVFVDGKDLSSNAPSLVFKALVTQTSTNAPTLIIAVDTIGFVSASYIATGGYVLSFVTDAFLGVTVICHLTCGDVAPAGLMSATKRNNSQISLGTLTDSTTFANGLLTNASLSIEVY